MPKLMIENASMPAFPTAVEPSTCRVARASIQASRNCMTVYEAICATVGSANASNSAIGLRDSS